MMRFLYRLLLRFYPDHVRAEFADEMLSVFDEAAPAARRQGFFPYALFCAREAGGLVVDLVFQEKAMRYRKFILHGALAGCVIGVGLGAILAGRPYVVTAVLRPALPIIPERFVPSQPIAMDRIATEVLPFILSRAQLTNVIRSYKLFPDEMTRLPLEDVVELMRKAISLKATPDGKARLSFTYAESETARKVVADLTSRILTEYTQYRKVQSQATLQFMKDAAGGAGVVWEETSAKLRAAQSAGQSTDRLRLDSDIARQRYELMSAKLADAEMLSALEERQQGAYLEVLDPASIEQQVRPPIYLCGLGGLLLGIALGWLISLQRTTRDRHVVVEA